MKFRVANTVKRPLRRTPGMGDGPRSDDIITTCNQNGFCRSVRRDGVSPRGDCVYSAAGSRRFSPSACSRILSKRWCFFLRGQTEKKKNNNNNRHTHDTAAVHIIIITVRFTRARVRVPQPDHGRLIIHLWSVDWFFSTASVTITIIHGSTTTTTPFSSGS